MTDKTKFDPNNKMHGLIVGAMAELCEQGMHPRDVFILLDDIKSQTWHGLAEIYSEGRAKVQ